MAERIELTIPSDGISFDIQDCLLFRCKKRSEGPGVLRESAEMGMQILEQVAGELRGKGYEVSEPRTWEKSFGASSMKCFIGSKTVSLTALPPDNDDEWKIRLTRRTKNKDVSPDSNICEELRPLVTRAVTKVAYTRELRWTNYRANMPRHVRYLSNFQW